MTEKTTGPKPFCFVLMPFADAFDDVYKIAIRESCQKAGAYCERVDEQVYQGTILQRIFNQIAKADFIVADMTGRNPNVFYEVGYAHALDKPTVLLTRDAADIPFDLKHFPHIIYGASKINQLRDELARPVRWFVEHPLAEASASQIGIEIYYSRQNLSNEAVTYTCKDNTRAWPRLTIHNTSSITYNTGDVQIGVITSAKYKRVRRREHTEVVSMELPSGQFLHMLPNFPVLFPGTFAATDFILDGMPDPGTKTEVTLRVFTGSGTRDYPLSIAAPLSQT